MKPTLSPLDKISIVIIAFLAIVPFQGIVYDLFMMKVFCFAIFAASLNLLLGYAGLLSFGHAAFFGTGAYITAYVMKEWGFTPELGLIMEVERSIKPKNFPLGTPWIPSSPLVKGT